MWQGVLGEPRNDLLIDGIHEQIRVNFKNQWDNHPEWDVTKL